MRLFESPRRMPRFGSLCSSKKRLRASPSVSGSRISPDTTTPGSRGSRKTWTSSRRAVVDDLRRCDLRGADLEPDELLRPLVRASPFVASSRRRDDGRSRAAQVPMPEPDRVDPAPAPRRQRRPRPRGARRRPAPAPRGFVIRVQAPARGSDSDLGLVAVRGKAVDHVSLERDVGLLVLERDGSSRSVPSS